MYRSEGGKMASRAQKILNLVREQEKTKSALEELDNTVQTDSKQLYQQYQAPYQKDMMNT
ncbi:unnamed protein product [Acanthoscelides obtectus]|uniref:Uncharacterized protein n=1 Tax=Acanthoscelides obtectus TaxID=200917 RepID=A0A9P0L1S1_ACAOB|nr:unnamed protein product [Acanthoscelides obtectus]CAK1665979.1 hypothetical protein AOBTE_LOCUS25088 [Acanthoscelides obtectus]